jgi:membrane protease YdiL (CAAX protease family)
MAVSDSLLDRIVYARPYELRWGWKLVLFLMAGLAASNVGVPLLAMTLPAPSMLWLRPSLECLAVLVATRYATTSIDPIGWQGVALGRAAWRPGLLVPAFAVGAAAIALPTGVAIATGSLGFVPAPLDPVVRSLALSVAILAPSALTEELLLRGYPFEVLRARWGKMATIAVTSVLFGVLHLGNPGATPTAIANVMAAGVFLAGIRVVTGSLAAAWAAHFAWNWTLSAGFHAAVSGLPFGTPGYQLVDTGSDWLSGGAWGPEGSVLVAVGMMGTFAGLSWAIGRNRSNGSLAVASATNSLDADGLSGRQEHQA